jgi:hypothetical protein
MTTFRVIPNTTQTATVKVVNDVIVSPQIKVVAGTMGPQGPTGGTGATGAQGIAGVVSASSPILYNSGTQTVSFDQTAQNTINDSRYFKRSGDTIDAGTIV